MKVLADSSIWIEHLREGIREFNALLDKDAVGVHPYVVGELACGTLPDRESFLETLACMPKTSTVSHDEAMAFLDMHKLAGQGLGWIDANLLASALVSGVSLWTRDKALQRAAEKLRIAF